ncbi:MAG: dTDP-4-dehydrorhamnose reductase [Solirubrobacteraceae bacterium]
MRLLVTGAAGMLGQDLVRAAEAAGHDTLGLVREDADIADPGAIEGAVRDAAPDVVINCAGWTDVDGAEESPEAAYRANATGAGNVATAAARAGAWVVQISTDYVFDGSKRSPYVESDPPSPLSRYGSSKLAGEHEVAARCPEMHTIARTSGLFGTGRCFPATIMRRAAERDELTIVDDQVGCPTFTGHLAEALVQLADAHELPLGIVHLAASGSCSWYEFAGEVLASAGARCELRRGDSRDLGRPAPRPAYSVLATEWGAIVPRLPDWREGVTEYLAAGMPTS